MQPTQLHDHPLTAAVSVLVGRVSTLAATTAKKPSSSSGTVLLLVVIAAGFYFLILRPQQQKAKRQREQVVQWEVGDEVLTAGGIVGHILDIEDDRVTLETSVGASFVVLRQYIIRKLGNEVGLTVGDGDHTEDGDDTGDEGGRPGRRGRGPRRSG